MVYLLDVAFKASEPLDGVQHEVVVTSGLPGRQEDGHFFLATEEKDKAVVLILARRRVSFGLQKLGKFVHSLLLPFCTHTSDADLRNQNKKSRKMSNQNLTMNVIIKVYFLTQSSI